MQKSYKYTIIHKKMYKPPVNLENLRKIMNIYAQNACHIHTKGV